MNRIILLILIIFSSHQVSAQDVPPEKPATMAEIETKPEFRGGIKSFINYISEHYRKPNVPGLSGTVLVTFVVEKNGKVTDIKVLRELGFGTGDEAIRVLKKSPRWKPGLQKGIPVRVLYSLPIKIQT